MTQLRVPLYDASLLGLHCALFDAAVRTGDVTCAEQQFTRLAESDAMRTQQLAGMLEERGELERTRAVLQRYHQLGGEATSEISNALLSVCASLGDSAGADAAAASLANMAPLTDAQMALLQRSVGEQRAEDFGDGAGDQSFAGQMRVRNSV